eukprot:TRINITY_DN81750_c0_g1_i1.p1 TRINITY_DN81750_c0_g1~~TRINITY_DN81750_c0_g1_i1.p1  ORF type:complete len:534 (+),score=162.07 TRINITY_DN81750_c0_g1_i1:92-1693(+)
MSEKRPRERADDASRLTKAERPSASKSRKFSRRKAHSTGESGERGGRMKDRKVTRIVSNQRRLDKGAEESLALAASLPSEASGHLEAEGLEQTHRFQQKHILKDVDVQTKKKAYDLNLSEFGPYMLDYSRNGRHLVLGGRKGHLTMLEWQKPDIVCEFHVQDKVYDVQFLHNEGMFAVAQKKYVYIYDDQGVELHRLEKHVGVRRLEFLPYHFLLCTIGRSGYLKYHDVSTGKLVAENRTKLGPCECITQNPWNAIIHLGHVNGSVTLWSPTSGKSLVKIQCHRGKVESCKVDRSGRYMVTCGRDMRIKVWDVRTYRELFEYRTSHPVLSMDLSQRGMLACSMGNVIEVWKDSLQQKQKNPYMRHDMRSGNVVQDMSFCPFEDFLGIGHSNGYSSMIVPGSGEPNFDTLESNPFETRMQRREREVHMLLDKIQPEMIMLDPTSIGQVQPWAKEVLDEEEKARQKKKAEERKGKKKVAPKGRKHSRMHAQKGDSKYKAKVLERAQSKESGEEEGDGKGKEKEEVEEDPIFDRFR